MHCTKFNKFFNFWILLHDEVNSFYSFLIFRQLTEQLGYYYIFIFTSKSMSAIQAYTNWAINANATNTINANATIISTKIQKNKKLTKIIEFEKEINDKLLIWHIDDDWTGYSSIWIREKFKFSHRHTISNQ